jgi:hypothetical protein
MPRRGRRIYEPVTFVRGVVSDQAFWNWVETINAGPATTAVTSVAATTSLTDNLNEALLVLTPDHPPQPCFIDAVLSATGNVQEGVALSGPASFPPGTEDLQLNGAVQSQGQLDRTVTLPGSSTHATDVFTAAGSLNENAVS